MDGGTPLPRGDAAAGDFVGTLLMVVLVVALGSVVAVLVASNLDDPAPPRVSMALAPVQAGDAELRLLHRNGDPVPFDALVVLVQRGDSSAAQIPRASWVTSGADAWRPGDRLTLPLSAPVAADERVHVRLLRSDLNALLADLTALAGADPSAPSAATLSALLTPAVLVPDGVSPSLLEVRVAHPDGALAVASVVADLGNASRAAGLGPLFVPLNDEGRAGDAVGGDGVWSASLLLPPGTPLGPHVVSVGALDAAGRRASVPFSFQAVRSLTEAVRTHAGVTFETPTSENVTSFRLRNWTWDTLNPSRVRDDFVVLRILGDNGRAWSCAILLDESGGVVFAKQMRVWGPQGETVYNPFNGTRLPLQGLDMDLLDPVASRQWAYASGLPHPQALYPASGVQGRPHLGAMHFGHDMTTANQQLSMNSGIFAVDAVVR